MSTCPKIAFGVPYNSEVEFINDNTAIFRRIKLRPNVRPQGKTWTPRVYHCAVLAWMINETNKYMQSPTTVSFTLALLSALLLCVQIYCFWRAIRGDYKAKQAERRGTKLGRGCDIIRDVPVTVILPPMPTVFEEKTPLPK